tara:strand:- start:4301 stop:6229 length:1929 start_codon:yes stop_codon:yes gene_type:complete
MIYIDRLSLKTSILAYRLLNADKSHGIHQNVQVLDPIKNSPYYWLLRKCMSISGVPIEETNFFTGHLRALSGESISLAALKIVNQITYKVANRTVKKSTILRSLSKKWGREKLILFFAKYACRIGPPGRHMIVHKILVSEALSRDLPNQKHYLILGLPQEFDSDLFQNISKSINLHTYLVKERSIKNTRLGVLLLIIFVYLNKLFCRIISPIQRKADFGDTSMPALLLIQEDALSMNRSFRGQPHWLFQNNEPPKFRTLVLGSDLYSNIETDYDELKENGVYYVPKNAIYNSVSNHPLKKRINSTMRILLRESIIGSEIPKDYIFQLAMLFIKAHLLSDFCISQRVKAFMTCDTHKIAPTAMDLVCSQINVKTFFYQYSNMSEVGPIMMSTADIMFSFSGLFHNRWINNGIRPKFFIDVGYIYNSSFDLVIRRANRLRKKLKDNGVQFIICYFDESVQENDKYGVINKNDHLKDILALAENVISDSSIAVITKSQYSRNSPEILYKGNRIIKSAIQTNRMINLINGKIRNNIFPAEAALASDIVINHAIGGSAGLEAALNGKRCILLNSHGMQSPNIEIYKKANILYENIDSALIAISSLRKGKNKYQNLGKWEKIIDLFDPYNDGKASNRIRSLLTETILK